MNPDTGAARRARFASDGSGVRFDDLARDGQAETRAVTLGGEKRLEQTRAGGFVHADALVVDEDVHATATTATHTDFDLAATRHGFTCVADQVEQGLLELRF